jgi:DASS family divalent anion:Na+ symporter
LEPDTWHLFVIFISTILRVLINALSIFTGSVLALGAVIMLGVLIAEIAFLGFPVSFILLILAAFLV